MPFDRDRYPSDWEDRVERIKTRAGQRRDKAGNIIQEARCEKCGALNHAIGYRDQYGKFIQISSEVEVEEARRVNFDIKAIKIILTTAHLDHDADNWNVPDDRLRSWCQKCHLSYDAQFHAENRKYGKNWRKSQNKLDI